MKPDHLSKRGLPTHVGACIHSPKNCRLCAAAHGKNVRGQQWLAGDSPGPGRVKAGSRGDRRRREIAESDY